jgi:hypothetical protein
VTRIGWLIGRLVRGDYLVCFKDLHLVRDNGPVVDLVTSLAARATDPHVSLRLILTSREPLAFLPDFGYMRLAGLDASTASYFFGRHNLKPSVPVAKGVHANVGGNPRLMEETARYAKDLYASQGKARDVEFVPILVDDERLAKDLVTNDYIVDELMDNAFKSLSETERLVLHAIATFDGPVHPRQIKFALLGMSSENVSFAIHHLKRQGLVQAAAPFDEAVTVIPVLREFYDRWMNIEVARKLHANLAKYYEEKGDILEATAHYVAAGERAGAARFLVEFSDYVDRDAEGRKLKDLVRDLLVEHQARALPSKIQQALREILASL